MENRWRVPYGEWKDGGEKQQTKEEERLEGSRESGNGEKEDG